MEPSSSFALSLKPNIAYLSLNLPALRKKQTTLPSFAYAGIPYQVFGESSGAAALMSSWSRFAMARSRGDIAAIAVRTALSPSAVSFSSRVRPLEQPGVVLHPGQRHAAGLGELAGRSAAATEPFEDSAAGRVGEGCESAVDGRRIMNH